MAMIGNMGAKAIFTTANVHMSLLATGPLWFSASSFSMALRANTVELFPAPKILDMKLMIMEERVSGSFCLGNSNFVKGMRNLDRLFIRPVRSAISMRPLHMAIMPARPNTNSTAAPELSVSASLRDDKLPVKKA